MRAVKDARGFSALAWAAPQLVPEQPLWVAPQLVLQASHLEDVVLSSAPTYGSLVAAACFRGRGLGGDPTQTLESAPRQTGHTVAHTLPDFDAQPPDRLGTCTPWIGRMNLWKMWIGRMNLWKENVVQCYNNVKVHWLQFWQLITWIFMTIIVTWQLRVTVDWTAFAILAMLFLDALPSLAFKL